jgi:hypothetical protein
MPEAPVQETPIETSPTESPSDNAAAPAKVRKKAEKKAAKAKPVAKLNGHVKMAKKPAKVKDDSARHVSKDLTVDQKRVAVLKALKQMGATGATTAKSKLQVAAKSGLSGFDVYGICYHKNQLAVEGLIKQAEHQDVRGLCYYVTAKGLKSLEK